MLKNQSGLKTLNKLAEHEGVDLIYRDEDGIWVELKRGWCNSYDDMVGTLHGIHEMNVRDVLKRQRGIVRCPCEACK